MSVVEQLIRREDNGSLSFGNYLLQTKTKKSDFEYEGDLYKVKTFQRSEESRVGKERIPRVRSSLSAYR